MRKFAVLVAIAAAFAVAPSAANAAITSALGIPCTTISGGAQDGQRQCGGTATTANSFDGIPIDMNIAFPAGGDGPFGLVMMFHGYGGGKIGFSDMQHWLNKGYAVFAPQSRGFKESCGSAASKILHPNCVTDGFVRLDDTRYEVRDAQFFAGELVDEGRINPSHIAATGGSYGGGMSMALAALKDRTMLPDGTLVPWKSPVGNEPMSLAVAIPEIPWSDLSYSLLPNGSNVDYIKDASYYGRFGVMKQAFQNGLYLSGLTSPGYYTAPGVEPSADLTGWLAYQNLGEPYDGNPTGQAILDEIQNFHSSYYIDHSQAPAPLMISSGFTDDLFPVNEATRFYNRTRAQYPNTPLRLFFGDFGHQRAQNKADVRAALVASEDEWVDHYMGSPTPVPANNVTAYTETCPSGAPSGGPYTANDWASISPGEIRLTDTGADQTIAADSGTPAVAQAFNSITNTPCAAPAGAKEPGTANYELPAAPAGGYTVLGSPTVVADITLPGDNSQIAARMVDVSPDGTTKQLVDRALWRPAKSGFQVFQLNPGAWKVEAGHVLRLELLSKDAAGTKADQLANYGRPSDGQQPATISKLDLRVPVTEAPGSLGGLVKAPAKKVLPDRPGVELAPGYGAIGSQTIAEYTADNTPCPEGQTGTPPNCVTPPNPIVGSLSLNGNPTIKGKTMKVKVVCKIGFDSCTKTSFSFKGAPKGKSKKGKGLLVASGSAPAATSGGTKTVTFKLTRKARKFFKDKKIRKHGKKKTVKGPKKLRAAVKAGGKSAGTTTIKRVGRVR